MESKELLLALILEQHFHVWLSWKENNLKLLRTLKVQGQRLLMLLFQKVSKKILIIEHFFFLISTLKTPIFPQMEND